MNARDKHALLSEVFGSDLVRAAAVLERDGVDGLLLFRDEFLSREQWGQRADAASGEGR